MLRPAFIGAVALLAASAAQAQLNSPDLKWGPAPTVFPKGAEMAVLSGNPNEPGMFVIRLRIPAGYRMAAHHHPSDEFVTIINGDVSLGMGDKFDASKGAMLRAGGFAKAPAKMNHYAWTKGGAVLEILAQGPFAMTYVNPADDPRRK